MSSRVRLLPTLMGAAGVLLALRIGAMASTPEVPPAHPEGEKVAEATDHGSEVKPADASEGAVGVQSEAAPAADQAETGHGADASGQHALEYSGLSQTKGEADVLQKLGERRAALDARERDLGLREQLLLAAERQIAERMAELKGLEQNLDVMMSKRNELEEAQIASLVKSYENMKPDDAARIFNRLERSILVDVASRMKPAKIGAVLAAMDPSRAQDLTVLLAKRMKLSQLKPVVLPVPPPPVAANVPEDVVGPDAAHLGEPAHSGAAAPEAAKPAGAEGAPHG